MNPRRNIFDIDQLGSSCTLNEVLDILLDDQEGDENHSSPEAIFISPPDASVLTDEDSGDENCVGTVENLSSRQLLSEAEVHF
ncbi:unnamed protein product, partial [Brenthis ino]